MKKMFTLVIGSLILFQASAQQITVATGGPGGTYSKMFKEATQACGSTVAMVEMNTSGSPENLNLLTGNKVNGAFVQGDVLAWAAKTQDLSAVKTLLTLHPEAVHFLAAQNSKAKTGGFVGIGSSEVVFNTIKDLGGYKVGAVGGSWVTANVIRLQAEIAYNVVEYPDNNKLLAAVAAGDVQAGLFVGGQPFPLLEAQTGAWKLLAISPDVMDKLKSYYKPTRLNYNNIRMTGIPSVTTDALFVTREYKGAKMVDALSKFRSCIFANLDDLAETTGKHPAWQAVKADNKGMWPYYELPAAAVAPALVPARKK